ncbi:hypothetical protein TTHERM_01266080 (macronuclear) [Tetrahymena thermophila SB210]|uniref:Uncharacterized protein n=1 Tax=Tetrahymena thermophila (strain SB210) TaxID=312017 RepID=Q248K3_TETTS|nr:hypothetical protein TTHERM_01266080 [Tetrahymena thermophila SB210]EAS04202.1 hypothetical protein TTHERM_01266080 [Tetrahymena thermophila SB210]|eukprot:XP_001024447.1 hypothetical protein TTHERM_01266080 [Tetrahymena thermophila SB210]
MITQSYSDDLQQISEEEYYSSTYSMFNNKQINCIGYDQLVFVANYPNNNMTNSQNLESKAYPINFNALDDMETESELSDQDAFIIQDINHEKIKLPIDSEFLNKSDQKNNIYSLNNENQEVQGQESKIQQQHITNIIQDQIQNELHENKDSKQESFDQNFKLQKKKSQIQKNEQNQHDEEGQILTQYQKKKILIEQLKEANILLDWDCYKKQNVLYEYSNQQGGASRRKKGKYSEIDIIDLPNPNFETNGAVNSSYAVTKEKERERESKRQKQNSKSSSNENQQKAKFVNFSSDDTDVVENIKTKSSLKFIQEEEGPIIEAIEVEEEELLQRQKEFRQNLFKMGRCTIPCNKTLVSSQVQAIIPQIKPIEEVKETWVLKDLDQLLQFKNSEQYNKLEIYMNQAFGVRKPEEVFNILKLNNYDLKQSIDYCNYQRDFLIDVFKNKDLERKKKLSSKRKLEKRDYI